MTNLLYLVAALAIIGSDYYLDLKAQTKREKEARKH